ncbi:ArsR/SmtB family transcription factor [Chelativorans xinjiangense]|uniref:ArsR/SmtB family transcription factor n=1 Tax=Chelativorans xinjiangense TaxID=2681485 RepID=UPI0013588069|nr:metalloregulator ArsR/SmtB family transcription factor [Chelativorans xinjiangense]
MMLQTVDLDRAFHALADPTRRGMVDRLTEGPASVKELAAPLPMALPSVLKHLRVLEAGGIVMSEKAGRVRTYHIEPAALAGIEEWVTRRKAAWNRQFDRLDEYLSGQDQTPQQETRK